MRLFIFINLLWLSLLPGVVRAEMETLLNKVAQAYGGETVITATRAYRQSGVTFSSLRGREGRVKRSYRHPDHLRVEIDYGSEGSELRVLSGARAWKQNEPVGEPFYSAMLLQAARLGLPAALFEFRDNLQQGVTLTAKSGQQLQTLVLNFHGKTGVIAGIDPKTGRILESWGILEFKNFRMEFGTVYDDFRLQNGRLFAFSEEHYAMGGKTGYTRLESIEIVDQLPDELFAPDSHPPQQPPNKIRVFNDQPGRTPEWQG